MTKYILVIGEEIVKNGQKGDLVTKYNLQLKVYNESGCRPSKKPSIWKLDEEPPKK